LETVSFYSEEEALTEKADNSPSPGYYLDR